MIHKNIQRFVSNVKEKQSGKYIYDTWKNVEPYKIFNITIDPNDPNKFITIGVIGLALTSSDTQTSTDISDFEITDYTGRSGILTTLESEKKYLEDNSSPEATFFITF